MKLNKIILETFLKFKSNFFSVLPLSDLNFIPQNFLVISNTALGDTLMSLPAIKSLKLSFPKSTIIALINLKWLPLFEDCPYIDILLPYKKGIKDFFFLIKKIKDLSPEIAFIFHGNYPEDLAFPIFSNIPWIFKIKCKPEYEKFLSYKDVPTNLHAIEKRIFLVKILGGKKIYKEIDLEYLDKKLKNINLKLPNINKKKLLIGFQLGASHLSRAWPVENFVELAYMLNKELECFYVLLGSVEEMFLGEKFKKLYNKKNYIDLVGKLDILKLAKVIKCLNLLITPDTGPLHLAVGLKTRTISLFALSKPSDTGPIQDLHLHKVIFKPEGLKFLKKERKKNTNDAMKLITPKEVFKSISEFLTFL